MLNARNSTSYKKNLKSFLNTSKGKQGNYKIFEKCYLMQFKKLKILMGFSISIN